MNSNSARRQDRGEAHTPELLKELYGLAAFLLPARSQAADAVDRVFKEVHGSAIAAGDYRIVMLHALIRQVRLRRQKGAGLKSLLERMRERKGGTSPSGQSEVETAFRALPPEFAEAVILADVAELRYEEIGRVLEIGVPAVAERLRRGRAAMRESAGPILREDAAECVAS